MPRRRKTTYVNTYRCAAMIPGMDYYECAIPMKSKRVPASDAKRLRDRLMKACAQGHGPWQIPRCDVRIEPHPAR